MACNGSKQKYSGNDANLCDKLSDASKACGSCEKYGVHGSQRSFLCFGPPMPCSLAGRRRGGEWMSFRYFRYALNGWKYYDDCLHEIRFMDPWPMR